MASPELTYFDGPGRANLTRLCFVAGGTEFIDTRLGATWAEVKADPTSTPAKLFGSMPTPVGSLALKSPSVCSWMHLGSHLHFGSLCFDRIKHGDLLIAQSLATACYAAELGGLGGTNAAERAICAMVGATNEDLRVAMYKCLFGSDESKTEGKSALSKNAAKFVGALERALERKGTPGPFFLGGENPSLADLAVFDNVASPFPGLKALGFDLGPYPKVQACATAVGDNDKIKDFVAKGWKL